MSASAVKILMRCFFASGRLFVVGASLWLAGCGGGGGGEPEPIIPPGPKGLTQAPSFDPPGGSLNTTVAVSLSSATPNAQIYFTTDGTFPIAGTSTLFSAPIPVSATTEIKALAIADGLNASGVVSARYSIGPVSGNNVPTLTQGARAEPATVTTVQDTATLSVSASDPEGDELSYAWTVSQGEISGSGATVTFKPPFTETDTQVIATVTISDTQGGSVQSQVSINVVPLSGAVRFNEALYAFIGPDTTNSGSALAAFDDVIADGNQWPAAGNTDVLDVRFENKKEIFQVVLSDSVSTSGQIRQATIEFSDGSRLTTGELPNDGTPKTLTFTAKQVDGLKLRLDEVTGTSAGIAELRAFSLLRDQTIVDQEQFVAGPPAGWSVVTNGTSGQSDPVAWTVVDGVYHQNARVFGQTADGFATGTYAVWDAVHGSMDLRLQVRAQALDKFEPGITGVMFGYRDDDNYYRFSLARHKSFHKLEKKQNGVFVELARSTDSFEPGEWTNLRVVLDGDVIVAYVNGAFALAAQDSAFRDGKIGLWNHWISRSADYDKLTLLTAPARPVIGLARPAPMAVFGGDAFDAVAVATQNVAGVEFVVDEGVSGREQRQVVRSLPFEARFRFTAARSPSLRAYALDSADQRLSHAEARAEVKAVGVRGLNVVTIGDSITNGLFDDVSSDDVSTDGRNASGGYQPILNNLLTDAFATAGSPRPVTVTDDSTAGDDTSDAVTKIAKIVAHNPQAQAVLVMYGTNDSVVSKNGPVVPVADYRARMKVVVDTILENSQAKVFLARILPMLGRGARNAQIRLYNTEIASLVASYASSNPGRVELGPDLYTFFNDATVQTDQYDPDGIHLNGLGYASMGRLWFEAINGKVP